MKSQTCQQEDAEHGEQGTFACVEASHWPLNVFRFSGGAERRPLQAILLQTLPKAETAGKEWGSLPAQLGVGRPQSDWSF